MIDSERQPLRDVAFVTATFVATATFAAVAILHVAQSHPQYPQMAWDIATAVAAIATITFVMARRHHAWSGLAIGAALGLLFFVACLGIALADPTNVEWLLRGDWAQHFVGWHLYRNASWAFPPGKFDTFWFPVGTAILYTDSLPLVAMPMKLVSPLLPMRFQYIGAWLLLNCVLQGLFGALLTSCFSRSLRIQTVGAALFILSPVFLQRLDHDTLTTQWLILAAFWLYFRRQPVKSVARWGVTPAWITLSLVASLVHPYLDAMVLTIALAWCAHCVFVERRWSWFFGGVAFSAIAGASAFGLWLAGAFTIRPSGGSIALGRFNANLLTWIDPQWTSRWLRNMPSGEGQYEGFGYLGLGVLVLAALALLLAAFDSFVHQRPSSVLQTEDRLEKKSWWPLLVCVAAMTIYAFGTRFTFGSVLLLDVTPSHLPQVLGAFRGSGRFIWPNVYLITLAVIVYFSRRRGGGLVLLCTATVVQVFDLAPLHDRMQGIRAGSYHRQLEATLHSPQWEVLTRDRKHIALVPPPACGKEAAPYLPFSLLAGDQRLTINTGYLARFDETRTAVYCTDFNKSVADGVRDADTLYIVSPEQYDDFVAGSSKSMSCEEIEGFRACALPMIAEAEHSP